MSDSGTLKLTKIEGHGQASQFPKKTGHTMEGLKAADAKKNEKEINREMST